MQLLRLSLQRSIFGYQQSLAMSTHYDVIVVGAGIFGSCAAYHSQKLGKKTLLLEQFARGHTNGSSHGKSRVTRYAHTQAAYVPLVDDAYKQIAELEKKRGEDLWKKTSLLWVATPEKVSSMNKILTEFGADHEVLPGSQISSRFPQFSYTDEVSALIDPMGGVLFADKWLNAFQDEFKKLGGTVHFEEEVEKLKDGSPAHVVTGKETYTADKLIVTVGSWVVKLFPNIGIKVQPQSIHVTYFKVKRPEDEQLLEIGSFPVFISSAIGNHPDVFGLPAVEYPHLIKFCSHHGEILDHGAPHNPGNVQEYIDIPSRYLADYLPVIDNNVQVVDKCKYTISEDHHYVIDKLPGSKNILLGACGSGSGFKVAPGIGRALAEMASGQKTTVDVSFFAIDRLFNISTEFNINSF